MNYSWGTDAASIHLDQDVHYFDHDVYHRMVIFHGSTVVWESCPQTDMNRHPAISEMGGVTISRTPSPASADVDQGTTVYYKVQTAPQNNTQVTAKQAALAQSA